MHVGTSWLVTGRWGLAVMAHITSELIGVEEPSASLKIPSRRLCHTCTFPNVTVLSSSRTTLSGSAACTC